MADAEMQDQDGPMDLQNQQLDHDSDDENFDANAQKVSSGLTEEMMAKAYGKGIDREHITPDMTYDATRNSDSDEDNDIERAPTQSLVKAKDDQNSRDVM